MPRSIDATPAAPRTAPDCSTVVRPVYDLNLKVTLMWVKTSQRRRGVGWWATETPEGSASVAFRAVGGEVVADAWGPGAQWAIGQLPALLGNYDDPSEFRPLHPVVRDLVAQMGVPRLGATGRWFEAMATAAVYQRVVSADARTAVARMGRLYGAEVPGGGPLPLFPRPEAVLRVPDHGFHRVGVDRGRARVIRVAAKHADRLEELGGRPAAEARQWLQRLPGVGPWTAARTTGAAAGDPDAVPVGDLHVPRLVTYALSGATGGDDDSMLELLEPYAGHRGRVVRLVKAAGIGPPRHHPAPTRYDISRI
ncbi:MAG: DNA-3-methyladenine glycosylase 2 family protein [Acidimicrobiaceae bacterium]|nr:DNA-3-methyladenine glycosylase 2 family protein [Acidimicrobiaceae bacterium]